MFDNFFRISSKITIKTASIYKFKTAKNIHRLHTASLFLNKPYRPWIQKVKRSILWNKFFTLMNKKNSSLLTISTRYFRWMKKIETLVVPIRIVQIRRLLPARESISPEVRPRLPFQEKIRESKSLHLK
jgi:hypothetical protein